MFENLVYHIVHTYGYVGIFFLMILQTVLVVIPSEAVIALSGALGLNLVKVALSVFFGLLVGSMVAFYISRYFGRKIVEKIVGKDWIEEVDNWIEKNGSKAILIARIIPLIPFDLISYVSGLTKLEFKKYFFATVIGMIPRILFLLLIGGSARAILSIIGLGIDFILVFGIIGIMILIFLEKRGYVSWIKSFVFEKIIKPKKFYRKKTIK
ncbi:MAG: VTT domain-containing protein [Candidatus Aenigmarchaeota archaeon]|nr:VTT domain-containing protein [Candidatus Aenigmarchaeota archaeon]